jgi:hypothetical protein
VTPTAPPVPDEMERLLRLLRLPYLRRRTPDVLATARAQRWDPAEVLLVGPPSTSAPSASWRRTVADMLR